MSQNSKRPGEVSKPPELLGRMAAYLNEPGDGLNPAIESVLNRFKRRRKRLMFARAFSAAIVLLLGVMTAIALIDYCWMIPRGTLAAISVGGYAVAAVATWWLTMRRLAIDDARIVARQLESADPSLREDLLSAVELADPGSANGSSGFRSRLQRLVARRTAGLNVNRLLPVELIRPWLVAGIAVLAVGFLLTLLPPLQFGRRMARVMLPGVPIERASLTKIAIVSPDPASTFVAEGDAVAVVAAVSRIYQSSFYGDDRISDVRLQYSTRSGKPGRITEVPMTPRARQIDRLASWGAGDRGGDFETDVEADRSIGLVSSGGLEPAKVEDFAANILVDKDPISYRVLAGDAVTLWETLTPLPRPAVKSFVKQYDFPSYARLPARSESSDHGDIEALVGTRVTLTIEFDEPVDQPIIKYSGRGGQYNLNPLDDSNKRFQTIVSVQRQGQYQIDATSVRSGLNNPFGALYSIAPIKDAMPQVRWRNIGSSTRVLSPLDVVPLAVIANDDLPLDRAVQEFEVNGIRAWTNPVSVTQPERKLALDWAYDLDAPIAKPENGSLPFRFSNGDIVQTRVSVVDRFGQKAYTTTMEWLIAEKGFRSDRHQRLNRLSIWVSGVTGLIDAWDRLVESEWGDETTASDKQKQASVDELASKLDDLLLTAEDEIGESIDISEAGAIESIASSLLDLSNRGHFLLSQKDAIEQIDDTGTKERLRQQLTREVRAVDTLARASRRFADAYFAQMLSLGLVSDAMSLHESLDKITSEKSVIPAKRIPRYLAVAAGRLKEMDGLIETHSDVLPDSTSRHLDRLTNWSDRWIEQLSTEQTEGLSEVQLSDRSKQFQNELKQQIRGSILDGRIAGELVAGLRDSDRQSLSVDQQLAKMNETGKTERQYRESVKSTQDASQAAIDRQLASFQADSYHRLFGKLASTIQRRESIHRARSNVDLQHAADLNSLKQAVENVSSEGFRDYGEEPADVVHGKLENAFRTLDAVHQVEIIRREVEFLASDEYLPKESAETRFQHPVRVDRIAIRIENTARVLRQVDRAIADSFDRSRYDENYAAIQDRVLKRRWTDDPLLSAESNLRELEAAIGQSLDELAPTARQARETILQYVLSLPELARKAAQQNDEASDAVTNQPKDSSTDSDQETSEESSSASNSAESDTVQSNAAEELSQARDATEETLEALNDLANTADVSDVQQRELARDADSASAQLARAMDQVQRDSQPFDQADGGSDPTGEQKERLSESLEALSDLLDSAADHFDAAERGESIDESREALRQAESELGMSSQQENMLEQSAELSRQALQDPTEMLRQLEGELQTSPEMQQSLTDLAKETLDGVKNELDQIAANEQSLQRSLEKSDPGLAEQKKMAARQISMLSRQSSMLERSYLDAVRRGSDWANLPSSTKKVDEARDSLRSATEDASRMGGENATLDQIQQTATRMAVAMKKAESVLENIAEEAKQAADDDLHNSENSRKQTQQKVERFERDARRSKLDQIKRDANDWSNERSAAQRRESAADRQVRDTKRQIDNAEQKQKRLKNPSESARRQIESLQNRKEMADLAKQAAEKSMRFAEGRKKQSQRLQKSIEQKRRDPLDQPNPAAELARRMASESAVELAAMRKQLGEVAKLADSLDQLRASQQQAQSLARSQAKVDENLAETTETLKRMARHEKRLGNDSDAEALSDLAESIQRDAKSETSRAIDELENAASDAEASPQASRQLAKARQKVSEASQLLSHIAGNQAKADPSSQTASDSPMGESSEAAQKSQMLDELDRAIAQSLQQSSQSGQEAGGEPASPGQENQSSQSGASDQGQTAGNNSSQPDQPSSQNDRGSSGQPSGQTAAEASPTLAAAQESLLQAAARRRAEAMSSGDNAQGDASESGPPSSESMLGDPPGDPPSDPPGGASVASDGFNRVGSHWGELRQRRSDDAGEFTGARMPPEYRREIEAYFRAVAERAGEQQ